jgi:hypothetical protein
VNVGTFNWIEGTLSCIVGGQRPETDMSDVEIVLTVREDKDEHVPELDLVDSELELDPGFETSEPETGRAHEKLNGGGYPGVD